MVTLLPPTHNVNVIGLCTYQAQIKTEESGLTQKLDCFATGENLCYITLVEKSSSPWDFNSRSLS